MAYYGRACQQMWSNLEVLCYCMYSYCISNNKNKNNTCWKYSFKKRERTFCCILNNKEKNYDIHKILSLKWAKINQNEPSYFSAPENLLNAPIAWRIFHTNYFNLFQICFSSLLICPFCKILFLKPVKLTLKETQELQNLVAFHGFHFTWLWETTLNL